MASLGRGVRATQTFFWEDFLLEFAGELLTGQNAEAREAEYSNDNTAGNFMFFLTHKGKDWCQDMVKDNGRFARLVNHSKKKLNSKPKAITWENKPRLVLKANREIHIGEELFFDYKETRKEVLKAFPFLND